MKKTISILICFLLLGSCLFAQNYPVTLRVVDKTFGVRTSNEKSNDEKNVVAGLSANLTFQGKGTGNWYYPLYKDTGTTGEIIKNDTAWIWQAVIQAPVGEHSWRPSMKSLGYKTLNKNVAYYGENDELSFAVDVSGKITGTTDVIIQSTAYPVTLKVIDKTKGNLTNDASFDEANISIEGGKPNTPSSALTNLHNEFILHNSTPNFSEEQFEFSSGVNIGVWLSQTSNRGGKAEDYFKKEDLKKLADMGFDHIRLPIDEKEIFDTNGNYIESNRQLVHNAIAWCKEYNMRIILDLHIIRSHYFNDDKNTITLWKDVAEQDKLVNMWEKLSAEYGSYSNGLVAYELLNETNAPSADDWNKLSVRIISKIREKEPNRLLIIGGISHNSASALVTLTVPENDKNIALAFHFYSPHLLTHYKASWMDGLKNLTVKMNYPGQLVEQKERDALPTAKDKQVVDYYNGYNNKSTLKEKMSVALNRAKTLGLKLYCSEYGCISNTNADLKYKWMRDVTEVFRENDIAFSVWGWKANFGIMENNGSVRDQRVIDAIAKGGGNKYNMFPTQGVVEKTDDAWIWTTTVMAKTGSYTWKPYAYSFGKSLNESIVNYDSDATSNGALQFNVGLDGVVSGQTQLTINSDGSSLSDEIETDCIQISPTLFDQSISIRGAEKTIEMFDIMGVKRFSKFVNEKEVVIDTNGIGRGLYVLVVDNKYSYKLRK